MENTTHPSREDLITYHEESAKYLREGIFEQKPWLKGAVSFNGPAEDHEEYARMLRRQRLTPPVALPDIPST